MKKNTPDIIRELKKSALAALWFMFLTFPIMVIKVNTITKTIAWRWERMAWVGLVMFILSFVWRFLLNKRAQGKKILPELKATQIRLVFASPKFQTSILILFICFAIAFPHTFSMYQTNIMISALIYVMLGLGLNIVIGLAGLLDLGYVAFFAVGAYAYALLNLHFGLGFWIVLPMAGILSALFGLMLGYPVLRLRGDYLAIVTLGFGEIIRLVLENWNEFSHGPSGIPNIPKPELFGISMTLTQKTVYLYYIIILLVIFTIFIINRLSNSRIGRAWVALKDDEIACQSMGIDKSRTKLRAFALGATWAGMGGVVFAAKTAYINPSSFTIWESVIILCTVVLGGMGSIPGVICGAFLLILLPEYMRDFGQYRMLVFGAVLVLMMVFKPGGMIENVRKTFKFDTSKNG